jgi:hypothetical protein
VSAVDFNDKSEPSDILEVYACGLPRYFDPPTYDWSTQTTITIKWNAPKVDGGCPIYDYEVQRDEDGTGVTWTEVNPSDSYPRNDPFIQEFECDTFPVDALIGDSFVFRVIGYNI